MDEDEVVAEVAPHGAVHLAGLRREDHIVKLLDHCARGRRRRQGASADRRLWRAGRTLAPRKKAWARRGALLPRVKKPRSPPLRREGHSEFALAYSANLTASFAISAFHNSNF